MKAQSNLMVRDEKFWSDSKILIEEKAENIMFFLDFYHDCYCISESAMERFGLQVTKFTTVDAMFKCFVYEDDLPYVLQSVVQIRNGFLKKKTQCRCLGKQGELSWVNCNFELLDNNLDGMGIVVGTIHELREEHSSSIASLQSETKFITDFCTLTNSDFHTMGYVMKLGIDNMKEINEKYGMHMADEIMQGTLDCILHFMDKEVRLYKAGSDKFILFDYSGRSVKKAEQLYRNVKEEVIKCNKHMKFPIYYTVSAGIAEFDSYEDNYIEQCKKVDFAFNTANRRGKNGVFLFQQAEYEQYIRKLDIEEKLRNSVENHYEGFEVYYQPIVDAETNQITGAEALLRWTCKEYENISPAVFIPLLEESGLIVPVGRWVMKTAVKQCKEWQKKIPGFRMNINVSYIQLKKSDVAFDVFHELKEYELDSKYVLFELTESGFIETDCTIRHIIKSLQKQKIKLGLDDFGTGYSNLCYLNDLKVYIIKIDRTFMMKALKSNYHYKLLRHIIDMAHSIQLKVCVEGVEDEQELQVIKELKPDYIQGYLFGKPVNKDEFYAKNM